MKGDVKILMVCLGNICRSPMAEGIMRTQLEKHNISALVDSAGTGGWHAGENPDKRAIQTMKKHGIDISGLIARQFQPDDFNKFDVILAMDESNYDDILALATQPSHRNKVKLMLSYHPGEKMKSVPDPWYGDLNGFDNVFRLLNESCRYFIQQHFK